MSTTMVHVRVDEQVKVNAAKTLAEMGLTVSDAVRMMLTLVAAEKALPFNVQAPNKETLAAMEELKAGKGKRFSSVEALMEDLNADD
jgi:DNA-damage-inducible protein J